MHESCRELMVIEVIAEEATSAQTSADALRLMRDRITAVKKYGL